MRTKRTIRKLRSPLSRDLARLENALAIVHRRLHLIITKLEDEDFQARANAQGIRLMREQTAINSALQTAQELNFAEDNPEAKRTKKRPRVARSLSISKRGKP